MNRKIEFRGKTTKGEWVYGCLLNYKQDRIGFYNSAYKFEINGVIPETVGQYTGLTDKNGKKVYEGDIVKDEYGGTETVKYLSGYYYPFIAFPEYKCMSESECEVIGNIFDTESEK